MSVTSSDMRAVNLDDGVEEAGSHLPKGIISYLKHGPPEPASKRRRHRTKRGPTQSSRRSASPRAWSTMSGREPQSSVSPKPRAGSGLSSPHDAERRRSPLRLRAREPRSASARPYASRDDARQLSDALNNMLRDIGVRPGSREHPADVHLLKHMKGGDDSGAQAAMEVLREEQLVYNLTFHELMKQVSLGCAEHGELLDQIRRGYVKQFSRLAAIAGRVGPSAIEIHQQEEITRLTVEVEKMRDAAETRQAELKAAADREQALKDALAEQSEKLRDRTARLEMLETQDKRRQFLRRRKTLAVTQMQTAARGYLARKELYRRLDQRDHAAEMAEALAAQAAARKQQEMKRKHAIAMHKRDKRRQQMAATRIQRSFRDFAVTRMREAGVMLQGSGADATKQQREAAAAIHIQRAARQRHAKRMSRMAAQRREERNRWKAELQEWQDKHSAVTTSMEGVEKELAKLQAAFTNSQGRIRQLESSHRKLQDARSVTEIMKLRVDDITRQLEECEARLRDKEALHAASVAENTRLLAQVDEMRGQVNVAMADKAAAEERAHAAAVAVAEAKGQVEQATAQATAQAAAAAEARAEAQAHAEEESKRAGESVQAEGMAASAALKGVINGLRTRITDLEGQLAQASRTSSEHAIAASAAKRREEAVVAQLEQVQGQAASSIDAVRSELEATRSAGSEAVAAQVAGVKQLHEATAAELEQTKAKLEEVQGQLEEATSGQAATQAELSGVRQELQDVTAELATAKKHRAAAVAELQASQQRVEEVVQASQRAQAGVADAEQRVLAEAQKTAAVQAHLREVTLNAGAATDSLKRKLEAVEAEAKSQQEAASAALSAAVRAAEEEEKRLRGEVARAKAELAADREAVKRARAEEEQAAAAAVAAAMAGLQAQEDAKGKNGSTTSASGEPGRHGAGRGGQAEAVDARAAAEAAAEATARLATAQAMAARSRHRATILEAELADMKAKVAADAAATSRQVEDARRARAAAERRGAELQAAMVSLEARLASERKSVHDESTRAGDLARRLAEAERDVQYAQAEATHLKGGSNAAEAAQAVAEQAVQAQAERVKELAGKVTEMEGELATLRGELRSKTREASEAGAVVDVRDRQLAQLNAKLAQANEATSEAKAASAATAVELEKVQASLAASQRASEEGEAGTLARLVEAQRVVGEVTDAKDAAEAEVAALQLRLDEAEAQLAAAAAVAASSSAAAPGESGEAVVSVAPVELQRLRDAMGRAKEEAASLRLAQEVAQAQHAEEVARLAAELEQAQSRAQQAEAQAKAFAQAAPQRGEAGVARADGEVAAVNRRPHSPSDLSRGHRGRLTMALPPGRAASGGAAREVGTAWGGKLSSSSLTPPPLSPAFVGLTFDAPAQAHHHQPQAVPAGSVAGGEDEVEEEWIGAEGSFMSELGPQQSSVTVPGIVEGASWTLDSFCRFAQFAGVDGSAQGTREEHIRPLAWVLGVMNNVYSRLADTLATADKLASATEPAVEASPAGARPPTLTAPWITSTSSTATAPAPVDSQLARGVGIAALAAGHVAGGSIPDSLRLPEVVYDYLSSKFGLRKLVDAKVNTLIESVTYWRPHSEAVAMFAAFLEESKPVHELHLLLRCRSTIRTCSEGHQRSKQVEVVPPSDLPSTSTAWDVPVECIDLDRADAAAHAIFSCEWWKVSLDPQRVRSGVPLPASIQDAIEAPATLLREAIARLKMQFRAHSKRDPALDRMLPAQEQHQQHGNGEAPTSSRRKPHRPPTPRTSDSAIAGLLNQAAAAARAGSMPSGRRPRKPASARAKSAAATGRRGQQRAHGGPSASPRPPPATAMGGRQQQQQRATSPQHVRRWISVTAVLQLLLAELRQSRMVRRVWQWASQMFVVVDGNGDGFITLREFTAVFSEVWPRHGQRELKQVFQRIASKSGMAALSPAQYRNACLHLLLPYVSVPQTSSIAAAAHAKAASRSRGGARSTAVGSLVLPQIPGATGQRRPDEQTALMHKVLQAISSRWTAVHPHVSNYTQWLARSALDSDTRLSRQLSDFQVALQRCFSSGAPAKHSGPRAVYLYRQMLTSILAHQAALQEHSASIQTGDLLREFQAMEEVMLGRWSSATATAKRIGSLARSSTQLALLCNSDDPRKRDAESPMADEE